MTAIYYVRELYSKRNTTEDCPSVTFTELDSWCYNDFVKNGFFETLKSQEYVHLYFDFDFKHEDNTLERVTEVLSKLNSIKSIFGEYYLAGYCFHDDDLDVNVYDSLPEEIKPYIVKKSADYGKDISFHVVFPETRILKDELHDIMKSGSYINPFIELADMSVYKRSGMDQLLRHPYARKYGAKDGFTNKDVNLDKMIVKVPASKLVATCSGDEPIVSKESWTSVFMKRADVVKRLLQTDDVNDTDDLAFGGEDDTIKSDISKELFELLYTGITGLEIHGDEEKTDKEITLFPLMSALYVCVGMDGITEDDVLDALEVIKENNTLTNNARAKWGEKRRQARNNKDCKGPGALFNYVKNFNPEYWKQNILPRISSNKSTDVVFDLRDKFCIKDIREKGAQKQYQVNSDPEKLDYYGILNDLRRVMLIVDKAEALYIFKERDAGRDRMTVAMCGFKTAKETLKQLKVGTELKKEKIVTRTAWDVFDTAANNNSFYKRDITFYSTSSEDFSYFQGYKYDSVQNDSIIEGFNNHIKHIWCKDDEYLYNYVQSWFATIIQHPTARCNTALVVKGAEGTGKNAITDVWCELLSGYSNSNVSDIDTIVGKFNTAVENKKLLVCNEMDSADMNSTSVFNRLKKLITENVVDINTKNITARTGVQNVSNYVFISNEFNPVKISSTDRRYCIFTPSEEVKGDYKYFDAMFTLMKDERGNYRKDFMQAIMYYYMNYTVNINLRNIPETTERAIAREANKGAIESFVEEYCVTLADDGISPVTCYNLFSEFVTKNGFKGTYKKNTFKAEMTKYCAVDSDGQLHRYKKQRVYRFTDAVRAQYKSLIAERVAEKFDLGAGDSDSDSDIPVLENEFQVTKL